MPRTRHGAAASPPEAAARGVEVALSFPFLAGPPARPLRESPAGRESGRGGAGAGSHEVPAEALIRRFAQTAPSRAYVGSETCDRLVPQPRQLERWLAATAAAGWSVSLVLPPLGREAQEGALETARLLSGVPGAEIVANDWGTVHLARARLPGVPVVLGRLTHKVLRDPRLAEYFDSPEAPAGARSALCRSGELAPGFRSLLDRYGIRRREIDPFLQPLEEEEWQSRPERLSVHLPYLFVTMGRACLPGAMRRERSEMFDGGVPCRAECRAHAVEFLLPDPGGNGAGKRLLALGNGFYHEVPSSVVERLLASLPARPQVDRVVVASIAGERPC